MAVPKIFYKQSKNDDKRHLSDKEVADAILLFKIISSLWFKVVVISVFMAFEVLIAWNNKSKATPSFYAVFFTCDILFMILNYRIVLPLSLRYYRSYIIPILLIVCSLVVHAYLSNIIMACFFPGELGFYSNVTDAHTINHLWQSYQKFLIIFLLWLPTTLLKLIINYIIREDNYHHTRISSHVILNVINQIHNNVAMSSPSNSRIIREFSQFTISSMKELDGDGKTFLRDEVEMIQKLILINELRFEHVIHVRLILDLSNDELNTRIPPQIFLTVVENLFKYGELNNPQAPATIHLKRAASTIDFVVENRTDSGMEGIHSTGLGLENLRRRIYLNYGSKAKLKVENSSDYFKVSLSIPKE